MSNLQFKDRDILRVKNSAPFQNSKIIIKKEFPNWGGLYAITENKNGKWLASRSHRNGDFFIGVLILEQEYDKVFIALEEGDKEFLNYFMEA